MAVFSKYAQFYDNLYAEKDYGAECRYLGAIISKYSTQPVNTILDLGCGTGGHVFQLAPLGYTIMGVDQSVEMLSIAQRKKEKLMGGEKITFRAGDIRSVELDTKYDIVISMFAVMSYMVSNVDLQLALKTARKHLISGGLFIFDVWHGPGVLTEPPADRYKINQQAYGRVIRFAHPVVDIIHHSVDVNYKLLTIEADRLVNEVNETHTMRFFFPQEIIFHLECAGFEVLHLSPFMELERCLNERDWNLSVVARVI